MLAHPPYHTNAGDMLARYTRLVSELAKWKLEFRDDSKLQQRFVRYGLDNLDDVVRMACVMHYLHHYTDFQERLDEAVELKRDDIGGYFTGIYMQCSDALRSSYVIPEQLPWMGMDGRSLRLATRGARGYSGRSLRRHAFDCARVSIHCCRAGYG
eukprot:2530421-Pleurochrysis_carterae.AAC.2